MKSIILLFQFKILSALPIISSGSATKQSVVNIAKLMFANFTYIPYKDWENRNCFGGNFNEIAEFRLTLKVNI